MVNPDADVLRVQALQVALLLSLVWMLASQSCDRAPCGQGWVYRERYVATLPVSCAMTVTVGVDVVTYATTCPTMPEFHHLSGCEQRPDGPKPAEQPLR